MRPSSIPLGLVHEGAKHLVVAAPDGDLLNPHISAVDALMDYIVAPGGDGSVVTRRYVVRCVLEEGDAEVLASGGVVWLHFLTKQIPVFAVSVRAADEGADGSGP